MDVSRRHFLQVTGASAAGAVLFNGCMAPEQEMLIQSPVMLPEDTVNSFENFYATSASNVAPVVCSGPRGRRPGQED